MALEIHRREKEGIQILDLHGTLAPGDSETILGAAVDQPEGSAAGNAILNLRGVPTLDEEGLALLAHCHEAVSKSGGLLKLLNIDQLDSSLIILTKLHTLCDSFTDEQEAVNSFFSGRVIRNFDILEWVQEQEGALEPIFKAA